MHSHADGRFLSLLNVRAQLSLSLSPPPRNPPTHKRMPRKNANAFRANTYWETKMCAASVLAIKDVRRKVGLTISVVMCALVGLDLDTIW